MKVVWIVGSLVVLLFVMLLTVGTPFSGYHSFRVQLTSESAYGAEELIAFGVKHEWRQELEGAGFRFSAAEWSALEEQLGTGVIPDKGNHVEYKCGFNLWRPITVGKSQNLLHASAVAGHRLQVEAWARSYPGLAPEQRKRIAWRIYGSGFHSRIREFLEDTLNSETDAELRAMLERMQRQAQR